MEIRAPIKYKYVFEKLPPKFFQVKEAGDEVIFICRFPLSISRHVAKLSPREFASFLGKLKVSGGSVIRSRDSVTFNPYMRKTLTVKVTEGMLALLREAAEKRGQNLRTYCRNTLLNAAIRDLEGGENDG